MKTSVSNWVEDFAPSMGAALSYYTVFSIAPLLVIVIAVAALVFGQSEAQTAILDQIRGFVGPEGASAIESMLVSAQKPKEGAISSALSVVMLLVGATTVFSELESDLNRIWRVPASKQSGIWTLLRTRVLSLGLVVTIGFLLMVSLVANAALAAWGKYWSGWFFGVEVALQAANLVLSLAVFTLLFATDVQDIAPREDRLARCVDRRGGYFFAVLGRQISDRDVYRQDQRRLELRGGRRIGGPAGLGVLLVAGVLARRRVHACLR